MDIESVATGRDVVIPSVKETDRIHLVFVSDAARATVLAAEAAGPLAPVYNIAGIPEDFISFGDIVRSIREMEPGSGRVTFQGSGPDRSGGFFDIGPARRDLNLHP